MTDQSSQLRAKLTRLRQLTFAEALQRVVDGDPLMLLQRAAAAIERAAMWVPVEVVQYRAAREVARELANVPPEGGDVAVAEWLDGWVRNAVNMSSRPESAVDASEWDAWARHIELVAARFGVRTGLGADALALFHELAEEERALLLNGMQLASERRTKELSSGDWQRFQALWRGIVRATSSGC